MQIKSLGNPAAAVSRVSRGQKFMVGSALAVVAGASFAQGADISAASDGLTQVATAVGTLGGLMLSAVGAGIVFKWVLAFLI